jgi:hypothetical protein
VAAAALVEVKKTGGWKSHRSGMKFDVFGNMVGNVFSENIFPNILGVCRKSLFVFLGDS